MLYGAVQFTWKSDLEDRSFDKLYLVPVFLLFPPCPPDVFGWAPGGTGVVTSVTTLALLP